MAILLIIHMTQDNESLRQICEDQVDPENMKRTATLMLKRIRDARQLD